MNKKKVLILVILSIFCIGMTMGAASAVKYKAKCHSNGVGKYAHSHKAVWTKKFYKYAYVGKVYKKGHLYKKYVKLYKLSCKCYNKAHTKQLKLWRCKFPYTYVTITATNSPKYKYKKVY